jgi:hypothetical protein
MSGHETRRMLDSRTGITGKKGNFIKHSSPNRI